jgi:hypothetical protein
MLVLRHLEAKYGFRFRKGNNGAVASDKSC